MTTKEFETYNNLVLANTLLGSIQKVALEYITASYIVVKKWLRVGIRTARTRTFPGADDGRDPNMVKLTQRRIGFDFENLNYPTMMSVLQALDTQVGEVEECPRPNNSKKAYQVAKNLIRKQQVKCTTIQDKTAKCLTMEHEILNIGA